MPLFLLVAALCLYLNTEAHTALDPIVERMLSLG